MEKVFRVTGYQKKIETSRLRSLCPKEHSGEFVDGCAAYLLYTLSFFLSSFVDIDIFCKTV